MLLKILDQGNLCALTVVIILLLLTGRCVAEDWHKRWGVTLAAVAFLGYGGYGWLRCSPRTSEQLLNITLRGLTAGGLAMGLMWIVLPLLVGLLGLLLRPVSRFERALKWFWHGRFAAKRQAREAEVHQRRAAELYAASAEDREQQQQEAISRAQAEREGKRRREDARIAAEVLFALHQHDIADQFSPAMFSEFMAKYMGDDREPSYVEQRSAQLQSIIQQLLKRTQVPRPRTIQELNAWMDEQIAHVGASNFSDSDKKVQMLRLQKRYDELMNRIIYGG